MLLLIALACGNGEDTGVDANDPTQWSVLEAGPYQVGYRTVSHEYTDPLGEIVSVRVHLWYPTEDTDGEAPLYLALEDSGSILEASLAPSAHDGGYPVMIYSHGSYMYGHDGAYLGRRLAQHGWVVAAPDHTGHLLTDVGDFTLPLFYHRPMDNTAALDAVEADAALGADANTTAAVLFGYSFGGVDSWAISGGRYDVEMFRDACDQGQLSELDVFSEPCTDEQLSALDADFSDTRVVAHIPAAGSRLLSYFDDLSGIHPTLLLSGTEDDRDVPQQGWDLTEGTPTTWATIEGGCHLLFAPTGCPDIDRDEGHDLISSYALAFSRQQVLGDEGEAVSDLLSGALTPWSYVTIQAR